MNRYTVTLTWDNKPRYIKAHRMYIMERGTLVFENDYSKTTCAFAANVWQEVNSDAWVLEGDPEEVERIKDFIIKIEEPCGEEGPCDGDCS